MAKLIISVKYQDVAINDVGKQQSVSLNVLNTVNLGANNAKDLISNHPDNDLKLGSDNKLKVTTDELKTSFEYAASVQTFWSI
jgi:hypothetical protein